MRLVSTAPSRRAGGIGLVTLVWLAAFLFSLSTLRFPNDHFGRISPARQIARYGELPFRDYFDPGYFLTELASAALLYMFGDNLLGEMLLELKQGGPALKEFEASQKREPNRFRNYYGAARAAEMVGDRAKAASYYQGLLALAKAGDTARPEMVSANHRGGRSV